MIPPPVTHTQVYRTRCIVRDEEKKSPPSLLQVGMNRYSLLDANLSLRQIVEAHLLNRDHSDHVVTFVANYIGSRDRLYSIREEEVIKVFQVCSSKLHVEKGTLCEGAFKTARAVQAFTVSLRDLTKTVYPREVLLLKNKHQLAEQSVKTAQNTKVYNPKASSNFQPRMQGLPFDREVAFMEAFKGIPGILQLREHFWYVSGKGRLKHCLIVDKYPKNLAQTLQKQSLPLRTQRKIQMGLLKAICHVHNKHFIHRDLKPENILLDENYNPVIADFGLSMGPNDGIELAGGTLSHLAPEAAYALYLQECYDNGDRACDLGEIKEVFLQTTQTEMDIFALGIIFAEISAYYVVLPPDLVLSGKDLTLRSRAALYPLSGFCSVDDIGIEFMDDEIDSYSDPFDSLVRQMVAYDPRKRIKADQALRELERIMLSENIRF